MSLNTQSKNFEEISWNSIQYLVMINLNQGSANCGQRATFLYEWNAARERKFCGPRACKWGPQSKKKI